MFNYLSELMYMPLLFDCVLGSSMFKTYWKFYVKQMRALKMNPKKLSKPVKVDQIYDLNKAIDKISAWLDENAYKVSFTFVKCCKTICIGYVGPLIYVIRQAL